MSVLPYYVEVASPLHAIALEECLTDSWAGPGIPLLLYVNKPSVIIGRNQNYWREVSSQCEVPVYRRTSGGGAVYHDEGNLNWAFIVPRTTHSREEELGLIISALEHLGVPALAGQRGGLHVLLFHGEGYFKIGGTARRFGSGNVLHHGTLLVHADLARMRACLGGIPVSEDSSIPSVPAAVINLNSIIPGLSTASLAHHLARRIAGKPPELVRFEDLLDETTPHPLQLSRKRFETTLRELASDEWIYGRTPPFVITLPSAGRNLKISVLGGRISEVMSNADSDSDIARMLNQMFIGKDFSFNLYEEMRQKAERSDDGIP